MISGMTMNQVLPPTRPVFGLRGDRSHMASRRRDQRRLRCS